MNSLSFPFEKLRGRENFDVWWRHAKSCLIIKNCWKVVNLGVTSQPDIEVNERALAEITLMIEPSNFAHIATATTAKEAWDALVRAYQDNGLTRKVELLKQLVQLKLGDFESMQDYINAMVMTSLKVRTAGLNIDDELTASLMLAGLPDEFRALVMAVENSKTTLTVDAVKNMLLQDAKFDNKCSESALVSNNKFKNKKFKCHSCNEVGHFSKNCPNKNSVKSNNAKSKNGSKNNGKMLYASLFSSSKNSVEWYVDSGATSHMTNNENFLCNKKDTINKQIVVANNNTVSVSCVGDVKMLLKTENNNYDAVVNNVEYIPDLCTNLLSVRQLTKKGNTVVFKNDICEIFDNDKNLIGKAFVKNDLYRLNCDVLTSNEQVFFVKENENLWHRRMGHICNNNLQNVKKSCYGINCDVNSNEQYVTCVSGKQTRKSFKESGNRATGLLEIIHSDVVGPFQQKSFSGNRYLLTFVDDYSRKVFAIPIKKKSDVFNEFVNFKNLVENQCSSKIKILRSDNGTEYVNNQFLKFLKQHGIVHQKTCPYTPEQNGVAERMNRTLVERMRCMLFDAELGEHFWAETSVTAAYLINRVPCRGSLRTPEEIWSNKKPTLKHLRVFGCKAMVHIPKEKRKKLEKKSVDGILVGYSTESKAYRIYNPRTKDVITSRDVIFFENEKLKVSQNNNLYFPILVDDVVENANVDIISEENLAEVELPTDPDFDNESTVSVEDFFGFNDVIQDLTVAGNNEVRSCEVNNKRPRDEDDVIELRRSERIAKMPRYSYNFCATEFVSDDPPTVKKAMSSTNASEWSQAMKEEYESLLLNKTWCLCKLPQNKKPISCKWVFKTKRNANGNILRRKARLVAKGYSQEKGIDYNETFAPVVRYESIRYLIALAVKHGLLIHQMDAVTAFLNGTLEEEIYMKQPECMDDGSGKVCKLQKSIYGLKQASRVWNETLNKVLLNIGVKRSECECIYYRINSNKILFIAIYVDDVLIFSNDIKTIKHVKEKLTSHFRMKDMGEASSILGIRITRSKDSIKLDQSQYIADVLKRFKMEDCNPVNTPVDCNQKISAELCPKTEADKESMLNVPYMQAIGCLLFAAQVTRPDICYIVNVLSRYGGNPGKAHWEAIKRVMRYLKGTSDKGLVYSKDHDKLTGYCDADWASDIDERRSTTGYLFTLQSGAISWSTKRQKTIALSTTEAEFMSMVAAIQEAIWLKRLENEISPDPVKTMTLHCDNKSAIHVALNNAYSSRTKHVDVRVKFIRECFENKIIELKYLPTNDMLADLLTKGVPFPKLKTLTDKFGFK